MTAGKQFSIASVFAFALLGAVFVPTSLGAQPFGTVSGPTASDGPYFLETLLPEAPGETASVQLTVPFTPSVDPTDADTPSVITPVVVGYHMVSVAIPTDHRTGPAAADQVDAVALCLLPAGDVPDAPNSLCADGVVQLTESPGCGSMTRTQYCVVNDKEAGSPPTDLVDSALIQLGNTNNILPIRIDLTVASLQGPDDQEFPIDVRGNWLPAVPNAEGVAILVTGPVSIGIETPEGIPVDERTMNADQSIDLCAVGYSSDEQGPASNQGRLFATWTGALAGELIDATPLDLTVTGECVTFNGISATAPTREIVATAHTRSSDATRITVTPGALFDLDIGCPVTAAAGSTIDCELVAGRDQDLNLRDVEVLEWHAHDGNDQDLVILPDGTFTAPEDADNDPVHVHAHGRSLTPSSPEIESNEISIDVIPAALALVLVRDMPNDGGVEIGDLPLTADENAMAVYCAGYDEFTNFIADVACDWHVDDGIGTVTPLTGTSTVFDATTVGVGHIHGELAANHAIGDETGHITVTAGALASFVVSCAPDPVGVGAQSTCSAADGADADGNDQTIGTVTWSALDSASNPVAIAADGTLTAPTDITLGPIDVTGTVGSVSDDASLGVAAGPLASITVTCAPNPVTVGTTSTCTASGADAFGNAQSTGTVTWSAVDVNGNPVAISSSGVFTAPTAVSDGPVTVTGASGAFQDTDAVALAEGALATLVVTCTPNPATVGATVSCSAQAFDSFSQPRSVPPLTWSAVDGASNVLSISASGVFTAPQDVNDGPVTVTAQAGAVSDFDTVTLSAGALFTFVVDCPATLAVATSGTCTAAAEDQFGNPRGDVPTSWMASAGSFTGSGASVTYFAPTATGSALITASAGAVTGSDSVTITPGPVRSLTMNVPAASTSDIGADIHSAVVQATGHDAFGNLVADGTAVYWTLLDPGAANVGLGSMLSVATSTTVAGVASVTLTTSTTPGDDYRVRAENDALDPTITRTSGTYRVGPGALDHFTVTCATTCTTAGGSFDVVVRAYDAFNNLLTAAPNIYAGDHGITFGGVLASPDGDPAECDDKDGNPVTLGGATTLTFASAAATVSCAVYRSGASSLTASEGLITSAGLALSVDPAAANKLVFVSPPSSMIANDCAEFSVQVRDEFGNAQPAGTYTVALGGDGAGTFYGENTCTTSTTSVLVDADADESAWFKSTTAENLAFTADTGGLTQGTTNFVVYPAAADHFDLSGAANAVAGSSYTLGISAQDQYHNVLSAGPNLYTGSKSITFGGATNAPAGNAPQCAGVNLGNGVAVTFASGAASVSCTLYNAQSAALQATDGTLVEAATLAVAVDPAAANALLLTLPGQTFDAATGMNTGIVSGQTAGVSFDAVLRALDVYRNVADSGANDYDGSKNLAFSGASSAFTGEAATAAATNFGTTTAVMFSHGVTGNVPIVLYRRETAQLGVAETPSGPATAANTAVAVAADGAGGTDLGVLNCNPALNNRACILKSQTVSTTLNAVVGNDYSLRAGKFDAYDNIAGGLVVNWASTGGVSPDQGGQTASSIIFSPDAAGSGTITVAKTGFNGDTPLALDVTVTA